MKRIISCLAMLVLFNVITKSQVTLTSERNPSIGDVAVYIYCDTAGILPGDSGLNVSWNFSNLVKLDSLTLNYIDPSTTPYFSTFPSSNVAWSCQTQPALYSYFKTSTTKNEYLGYKTFYSFIVLSNSEILMHYPFTYNSIFNDTYSGTQTSNSFITGEIESKADATGVISLPFGIFNDALRIHTIDTHMDSIFNTIDYTERICYEWYVLSLKFRVLGIYFYTDIMDGDTTKFKEVIYCNSQPLGKLKIGNTVPDLFKLYQNYPNPFNPTTKIKFEIPKSGDVKLVVYDVLGREVTTLVNEYLKLGAYEVEWNALNVTSGVYFYKLTASDFTETKRMVLVK